MGNAEKCKNISAPVYEINGKHCILLLQVLLKFCQVESNSFRNTSQDMQCSSTALLVTASKMTFIRVGFIAGLMYLPAISVCLIIWQLSVYPLGYLLCCALSYIQIDYVFFSKFERHHYTDPSHCGKYIGLMYFCLT